MAVVDRKSFEDVHGQKANVILNVCVTMLFCVRCLPVTRRNVVCSVSI